MKVDFLNELVESRMFKHLRDFSRYNNRELAELSYICLLIVVIHRRHKFVKEYLDNTLAFGEFEKVRSSGTDLGNVIAVLKNFAKLDIDVANQSISFPEFQFKQFARSVVNDTLSESEIRRYMFAFEDYLKISQSDFRAARRIALDWYRASYNDRTNLRRFIINQLNQSAMTMDLANWFKSET